jgi:sulfatase-modifying factor enzyme 1
MLQQEIGRIDSVQELPGTSDMIWIPGGTFRMGSDHHYPEEAPAHRVTVDGFWIDPTPVTNRQFKQFVKATGHKTVAEIPPDLRYDHAFNLASGWILATRTDLPLLAKNAISDSNLNGDYVRGIGDADVQAALIHGINQRWAFGFGMRLIAPTGDDVLGSGKWQVMPIVGARLALPEITSGSYFEPVFRYDVSVAGDPTRKNISNLQFAPMLNIALPGRWFVTLFPSPDIRINYGDPITGQTGRWFVPFDFRFGKKFTENIALSLEFGVPIVKDYPVYDFKTQLRLNVTW